jgi:hypothetical protein
MDLGEIPDTEDATVATFDLQSFRIRAHGGALDGVEHLRIVVSAPPGSSLTPIVVIDYPAPSGLVRDDGSFFVDLTAFQHDLADYLEEGGLVVQLDAAGVLPAGDWSADLEMCMGADAEHDYGQTVGL